jgi:hypothetical protein
MEIGEHNRESVAKCGYKPTKVVSARHDFFSDARLIDVGAFQETVGCNGSLLTQPCELPGPNHVLCQVGHGYPLAFDRLPSETQSSYGWVMLWSPDDRLSCHNLSSSSTTERCTSRPAVVCARSASLVGSNLRVARLPLPLPLVPSRRRTLSKNESSCENAWLIPVLILRPGGDRQS